MPAERQTINCWKSILAATKLTYANKTRQFINSQKRGSHNFKQITSVFSLNLNMLFLLYLMVELSLAYDKMKLFPEIFCENSILVDSITLLFVSLPAFFSSGTNLKLCNVR